MRRGMTLHSADTCSAALTLSQSRLPYAADYCARLLAALIGARSHSNLAAQPLTASSADATILQFRSPRQICRFDRFAESCFYVSRTAVELIVCLMCCSEHQ